MQRMLRVLILSVPLAANCGNQTSPTETPQQISPRNLVTSASISLASSSAPSRDYYLADSVHVRVFPLGTDAEIEVRFEGHANDPLLPSYIIARRDSLYAMNSSGILLAQFAQVLNTSAALNLNDTTMFLGPLEPTPPIER